MNLLTKFHEDCTINVASRMLTRFYYSHIKKNVSPLCSHVFQVNVTIFKLIQDIIETNLLTKFHEDWTINVASRVFTRKNALPLGSHVFQANVTLFELIQDIIQTNLLTKFHEDWTINVASRVLTRKTAPPPGGHFHDDLAKIVTSRAFTRNTAPPPGGHVFQRIGTIFELNQHIIKANILTNFELRRGINGTNVLTKVHEDQTINVASRVFTRQMLTARDVQKGSQKLTMSMLCSGELKINT
ncbi:hypothetical protein DPMN_126329 [Dreissena polymorpha]|uniref:Uncharacterized protein n=1 Tax=Dreissena polymorpha TaxID=45954 RepID=A0A9D4H349_DREPO|nr:hypothetical protein DPMN_126329 [Dreissena polymorpha]